MYPDEPLAPPPGGDAPAEGHEPERERPPASRRLASAFEVLLCSGFPTQLTLSVVLAVAGLAPFDAHGRLSAAYVFTLSLLDAVLVISLVLLFLRLDGERPRSVLLGGRPPGREVLVGLALVPAVFGLAFVVLAIVQVRFPWLHNVTRNPLEGLIGSPLEATLFAGVTVASGGFREEIQRAFILHRFEQHLGGAVPGLLLFSVLFGAGHWIQGWDAVLTTAALGAFWGVVYLHRRSIVAPIVSHAGFDVSQVFRYTFYGA